MEENNTKMCQPVNFQYCSRPWLIGGFTWHQETGTSTSVQEAAELVAKANASSKWQAI